MGRLDRGVFGGLLGNLKCTWRVSEHLTHCSISSVLTVSQILNEKNDVSASKQKLIPLSCHSLNIKLGQGDN